MSGFRPRFFIPVDPPWSFVDPVGVCGREGDLAGSELALTDEDSHHALRVLRLSEGDECEVVAGAAVYAATVRIAANPVRVRLVARLEGAPSGAEYRLKVGLVQALIRPSLVDYVVEKGTEVGASFFLLVAAAGSPARAESAWRDRLGRWRRIAREAAKQSKQVAVPPVDLAGSIDDALDGLRATGALSVALEPGAPEDIPGVLGRQGEGPAEIALWVGPEGGWAPTEVESLSAAGAEIARLGSSILRAETAGPVALALARFSLGDW